jgi:3-oxoacyl-[acyl-carrier protein] reductase
MPETEHQTKTMLLEGKNAVIYGGGGSIGSAVALAFAREGARVFLAGRTASKLDRVAEQIAAARGEAATAELDALDEKAVDEHADGIVKQAGTLDVSFNLITHPHTHGVPLHEMGTEDFLAPVEVAVRALFITARAAARHMIEQRSGVLLAFGGPGDRSTPLRDYYLGGTQVAFDAVETMRRQLSVELGAHGIRFVTLETGGVPETFSPDFEGAPDITKMIEDETLLGRAATLEDVGNAAAFAASDKARMMTAATLNVSGGTLID